MKTRKTDDLTQEELDRIDKRVNAQIVVIFGKVDQEETKYPSRAKFQAPEMLGRFIRLVNLVPVDRIFPDSNDFFSDDVSFGRVRLSSKENGQSIDKEFNKRGLKRGIEALRKSISDLPETFHDYLFDSLLHDEIFGGGYDGEDGIISIQSSKVSLVSPEEMAIICKYEEFIAARALLYEIAFLSSLPEDVRYDFQVSASILLSFGQPGNVISGILEKPILRLVCDSINIRRRRAAAPDFLINRAGIFRLYISPVYRALESVDVTRLKICDVCGQLFWAERADKKACQARCATTLRKRRSRENKLKSGHLYEIARKKKNSSQKES